MQRNAHERDVPGEAAYPSWGTVTPVARMSARTVAFKGFGFFKAGARPLQVEVVRDGRHEVVSIPDLQSQILGALAVVFAVGVVLMTLLRRNT